VSRQVQTVITVTCDACSQAGTERDQAKSYAFGWKDTTYEIDLCDMHAQNIEAAFAPWIGFGRRSEVRNATTKPRARANRNGRDLKTVREWAKQNNYKLGDRGRIPREILDAYEQQAG
jgi:hypothetical protein